MTISEIKDLTKFLTDADIQKIKYEIKSKETVLKSGNLEEEEIIQVLNTLFGILVIEKTLELEIEDVEQIRDELQDELTKSYEIYDSYMVNYKKKEKKKKRRWLLDFLFLSDLITKKKETISSTDKALIDMKKELNQLKQEKSNENLKEVVKDRSLFENFCDFIGNIHHPHENSAGLDGLSERRQERLSNIEENRTYGMERGEIKRETLDEIEDIVSISAATDVSKSR